MNPIIEKVLKRIKKIQEEEVDSDIKTTAGYRPASESELAAAVAHAKKLGVSVSGEVLVDKSSGYVIMSYVKDNEIVKVSFATEETEKKSLEEASEVYKVGDVVTPTVGPMKGIPHNIIHVFPDGTMNIKPQGGGGRKNAYRLGAAKAKPDQVKRG